MIAGCFEGIQQSIEQVEKCSGYKIDLVALMGGSNETTTYLNFVLAPAWSSRGKGCSAQECLLREP